MAGLDHRGRSGGAFHEDRHKITITPSLIARYFLLIIIIIFLVGITYLSFTPGGPQLIEAIIPIITIYAILIASLALLSFTRRLIRTDHEHEKQSLGLFLIIGLLLLASTGFLVWPAFTSDKGMQWMVAISQLLLVLFAYSTINEARRSSKESTQESEKSIEASRKIAEQIEIDRRVDHIRTILSELYSPLINDPVMRVQDGVDYHNLPGAEEFMLKISMNAYLAQDGLKIPLQEFLEADSKYPFGRDVVYSARRKVINVAMEEYQTLLDELNRLTSVSKK